MARRNSPDTVSYECHILMTVICFVYCVSLNCPICPEYLSDRTNEILNLVSDLASLSITSEITDIPHLVNPQ